MAARDFSKGPRVPSGYCVTRAAGRLEVHYRMLMFLNAKRFVL